MDDELFWPHGGGVTNSEGVKDESAVPQNQKALGKKKEDCRADKP
jgi:ribosomal protein L2